MPFSLVHPNHKQSHIETVPNVSSLSLSLYHQHLQTPPKTTKSRHPPNPILLVETVCIHHYSLIVLINQAFSHRILERIYFDQINMYAFTILTINTFTPVTYLFMCTKLALFNFISLNYRNNIYEIYWKTLFDSFSSISQKIYI